MCTGKLQSWLSGRLGWRRLKVTALNENRVVLSQRLCSEGRPAHLTTIAFSHPPIYVASAKSLCHVMESTCEGWERLKHGRLMIVLMNTRVEKIGCQKELSTETIAIGRQLSRWAFKSSIRVHLSELISQCIFRENSHGYLKRKERKLNWSLLKYQWHFPVRVRVEQLSQIFELKREIEANIYWNCCSHSLSISELHRHGEWPTGFLLHLLVL